MAETNTDKKTSPVKVTEEKKNKTMDKVKNYLKTTKGKVVSGTVGVALIVGAVGGYSYYEKTKPVGNSDTIVTSKSEKDKRGKDLRAKNVLAVQADGKRSDDRGFKFLFESPISNTVNSFEQTKNKQEFNGSTNFINNLITLLATRDKGDVNSAAALYSRNAKNYKFTDDDNLVAVGIGRDALLYNDYLSNTDKVSNAGKLEMEKKFAKKFKDRMATPFSGATIASSLSVSGLSELVLDGNSTAVTSSVLYTGSKQFKDYQNAIQDSTKIDIETTYVNKTLEAWNSLPDVNSVYEVYLTEVETGRQVVAVITENQQGRLSFYGLYHKETYQGDQYVKNFRSVYVESGNKANEKDLNWDTFVEYTK